MSTTATPGVTAGTWTRRAGKVALFAAFAVVIVAGVSALTGWNLTPIGATLLCIDIAACIVWLACVAFAAVRALRARHAAARRAAGWNTEVQR